MRTENWELKIEAGFLTQRTPQVPSPRFQVFFSYKLPLALASGYEGDKNKALAEYQTIGSASDEL